MESTCTGVSRCMPGFLFFHCSDLSGHHAERAGDPLRLSGGHSSGTALPGTGRGFIVQFLFLVSGLQTTCVRPDTWESPSLTRFSQRGCVIQSFRFRFRIADSQRLGHQQSRGVRECGQSVGVFLLVSARPAVGEGSSSPPACRSIIGRTAARPDRLCAYSLFAPYGCTTVSRSPAEGVDSRTSLGFVVSVGVDVPLPEVRRVRLSPELRYTRWGTAHVPGVSNLDQLQFLVGLTF